MKFTIFRGIPMPVSRSLKIGLDVLLSLGITWFISSPWLLGVDNKSATLDAIAIIVGTVALCASFWAMFRPDLLSPEVLVALCGALLIIAPSGMGFASFPIASKDSWIAGAVLLLGAGICLLLRASDGLGEASRVRWRHAVDVIID
ncbi:MAG TPA: hypothetical protein VF678_11290 [bacterium]